ncbi:hypothetical protein BCR35DRAFT_334172 [Leucosporidium creatinivorum]|uniref:Uncharacterized protein n=1 Tax=Leucosporidium creatinivorum TaxID=106004 RepID=A0A1Y2EHJ5_9BASI|nr:hypothetical protein BCR35DRAFT_334172 [Leucosporidium creatinivorum]
MRCEIRSLVPSQEELTFWPKLFLCLLLSSHNLLKSLTRRNGASTYALAFAVVDSPITALATKVTGHGASPCTPLIHIFSNISTSTPIDELTTEIEKAVALWREKESKEARRMSPDSPSVFVTASLDFILPYFQRTPAPSPVRPPVLEVSNNFGLGASQANVFVVALKDDKSLNTLKDLLKDKIESIVQSMEQEKAFPSLELVQAPSAEAAEQLSKESVEQFELTLRDDGMLESIAGERELELEAVVVLKKSEEGWAEVAGVDFAREEEEEEEEEEENELDEVDEEQI